ncbi:MAG: response regulator transcription factor [Spirochaetia bacterium]|jgi:DNA-binding response OmpR family regulator
MNELIAIVEDEDDIRALVSAALKKERYRVREYAEGKGFLASLRAEKPDLVVLDVMLPDTDGFAICRGMRADRAFAAIPVIMLTARAEEADRVLGLELGADDYVAKPFSPKELAARVRAVLRRSSPEAGRSRMDVGNGLLIDSDTMEAFVHGRRLDLTHAEFRILRLLASRTGWVFSREKILDHLWGDEKNVTDRSVDVHVKHLRDKLGPAGGMIVNVRGVGYKLSAEE